MHPRAVAFDLGNTLVSYYERHEFPTTLDRAIRSAYEVLSDIATVSLTTATTNARAHDLERDDGQVQPLEERLAKIIGVDEIPPELHEAANHAFLRPIFQQARKYEDSEPTLLALRERGLKLAIVSNSPWGTSCHLWRKELSRHGLLDLVDASVFCGEVGWRKPALPIFKRAAELLGVEPADCVFVGDELLWDVQGAAAAGMHPILIDRSNKHRAFEGRRVTDLWDLQRLI